MPRIRYTPEEKEKALRLCNEIGVHKTSEQTGISVNSLYKWRSGTEDEVEMILSDTSETPDEEMVVEEKNTTPNQENMTPRKRYTNEEKENALRLCDKIGITKASNETGITVTSLRKWRIDAQSKIATVSAAADESRAEEVVVEEKDSHPNHADTIDVTDANAPTEKLEKVEKASHLNNKDAGADEKMSEELIRLQIENSTLKAQIIALKSALRIFTE